MFELDLAYSVLLIICLIAACGFEFVNGFHDTANAVATVIYTNSLKPWFAVIWSGSAVKKNEGKVKCPTFAKGSHHPLFI